MQYQVPLLQKYRYPIVLMHGGGHTAKIFLTTPDGREGWFTSLTRRGFAVYAVDGPNRGRAGWDPTDSIQATPGLAPASSMEAANMYTEEKPGSRSGGDQPTGPFIPTRSFRRCQRRLHKADPAGLPQPAGEQVHNLMAADLRALVDKIGPCILLGWSTGSLNVMQAASSATYAPKVKGLIGIEGFTASSGGDPALVKKIPELTVIGDNRDPTPNKAWSTTINGLGGNSTTVFLPDVGIFGTVTR